MTWENNCQELGVAPCCKTCGNAEGNHAVTKRNEVGLLRSLGYEVTVCNELDPSPLDPGSWVEKGYWWTWVTKDGTSVDSFEVDEVCSNHVENPCDSAFMEEIST